MTVSLAVEGHELAAAHWVVFGRETALHCPQPLTDGQAHDLFDGSADDVVMLCGRRADGVLLPGLSGRLETLRCGQCADRSGVARGHGSPKNIGGTS